MQKNYEPDSRFILEGRELFGEKTEEINFQFYDYGDDENHEFFYVQVTYPDEADMEHVLEEMQKVYGEPDPDVKFYYPYSQTGSLSEYQTDDPQKVKSWAQESLQEMIPKAEREAYLNAWKSYQFGLNEENGDTFIQNSRSVRISWIADGGWNRLEFDAANQCIYDTIKNQLADK